MYRDGDFSSRPQEMKDGRNPGTLGPCFLLGIKTGVSDSDGPLSKITASHLQTQFQKRLLQVRQ